MRDLLDILAAFDALSADNVPMALATIVAVEGSSYRRPGARMLIAVDGRRFGTVSGGCLEADVARRAQAVIASGEPTLCRYETGDDPDQILYLDDEPTTREPGVSLGCGGALEIFIEPVSLDHPGALQHLQRVTHSGEAAEVCLIYRVGGSGNYEVGLASASLIVESNRRDTESHLTRFQRLFVPGGWVDVLIETIAPPPHLMILGDGPDTVPLIELAKMQGWRTTVAGYRSAAKLPADRQIHLTDQAELTLTIDPAAAVVVMTHDLLRDARLLRCLAKNPPAYVGVLGPMHRTRRLLAAANLDESAFAGRLFAPIGLDLGGEGAQRVALSIVAEIAAVLSRHAGGHLRDKFAGIHEATFAPSQAIVTQ